MRVYMGGYSTISSQPQAEPHNTSMHAQTERHACRRPPRGRADTASRSTEAAAKQPSSVCVRMCTHLQDALNLALNSLSWAYRRRAAGHDGKRQVVTAVPQQYAAQREEWRGAERARKPSVLLCLADAVCGW
jgi:hypothetical protein